MVQTNVSHKPDETKTEKHNNYINVNSKINVLIYNNQCSINSGQMEIAEYHTSVECINWEKTDEFLNIVWNNQISVDVWMQVTKNSMQWDHGSIL